MSFYRLYFRQNRRMFLLFCLCSLIFAITFFLYGLPLRAVGYPVLLCLVPVLCVFAAGLREAKKKHRKLLELSGLSAALMEHLPDVKTADDADYQAVIQALRREENNLRTEMSVKYQDMCDYYTIWAHQIKTPIASMKLTLQNEDSQLSRQLSEELQRIEQYVSMVLAFLRLDSDVKDYVFREQDLDGIIKEAVRKLASQFIRKRIRLCYEPLRVSVLTDEKWLSFVVEQVLSNALKYTAEGSITIELEEPLTLCIRDTGIGIAPEDLPRVFEKSYTGYNGRSDKKASGIGLYLCRKICENLGHGISVRSSQDSGTTVRIRLDREKIETE